MVNPIKKSFDSVLKVILEGYVEVVNWIRKVRYPARAARIFRNRKTLSTQTP